MVVKEIPEQTQKNVDLETIETYFFDSMNNFHGKHDLSWIDYLLRELRDVLKVKKGMVHCHEYGSYEVPKLFRTKQSLWVFWKTTNSFLYKRTARRI